MKPKSKRARVRHGRSLAPYNSPTFKNAKWSSLDSMASHHLPPPPASIAAAVTMRPEIAIVQQVLCYTFRNPGLLDEALTHSSASAQISYQRLEFVGDAALGLAFANYLYITNPGLGPGELSTIRAANVSTEKLARAAVRHGLYRFLRCNSQELSNVVDAFSRAVTRETGDEIGGTSYGGRTKKAPKVLADIVESIAGAIYLDSGLNLEIMWTVLSRILAPIVTPETIDKQPVTSLIEHCQKHGKCVMFKDSKKRGKHTTQIFVDGKLVGSGSSEHKDIAKLNAARDVLQRLSSGSEDESGSTGDSCRSSTVAAAAEEKEGAKMRLNELCSKRHWTKPEYRMKEEGPAHDKRFTCTVEVRNSEGGFHALTRGAMNRIKDAENDAAFRILAKLL